MNNWIEKLDPLSLEGAGRTVSGIHAWIVAVLAVAISVFVLSFNSYLLMDLMSRSGLFMGLLSALVFLLFPWRRGLSDTNPSAFDYALALVSLAVGTYIILIYDDLIARNLELTTMDIVFGTTAVILVLEAGRRSLGIWLPALCVVFILYALYGKVLPAPIGHFGVRPERFILRMYFVSEGLFGSVFQIAQTYIALFVVFGSFLIGSGATETLTRLGMAISGRFAGGPAKVAVIASGFTGMISGSAAANVATTGSMTIPMMKDVGFKPYFAGAVEAIASTGGLIMPPIMGAAAFLMVEFIGVSYLEVISAAVIPALLYYGSLLGVVHFRAVKLGIRGLPRDQIPALGAVLVQQGYLLIPVGVLMYFLIDGYTPIFSALYAILSSFVVSFFRRSSWMTPKRVLLALMRAGAAMTSVGMACLAAGIIVGVVSMTGIASVFTSYIEVWSGGWLLIALLMTAVAAILLSCALPATAVYIVAAITIAPALIEMGAKPLAAHFFVFWFGVLSNITPPVAIACFTAAGIAGASPTKIAFHSMRMALPAFLIAFIIVYHPDILFVDWTVVGLVRTVLFCVVGIGAYIIATEGFLFGPLSMWERAIYFSVMILCLALPGVNSGFVGLGIGAVALTVSIKRKRARAVE